MSETQRLHRRFDRVARLLGEESVMRLHTARVVVFGIGGVGSFAAEALARSGVGELTLVDFDLICVTNTNRQMHAMRGNIGKPKAEVMAERLRLVHPTARVEARVAFYSADDSEALLDPRPDYVVDAIDNLTAKAHLLVTCARRGIPVVSSMGAAARMDPTRVRVDDLARTHSDPMASALRDLLRKHHGWNFSKREPTGIACVFSDERPVAPTPPAYDGPEGFHCVCPQADNDLHSCDHRSRIEGSAAWVTGTFGLVAASVAVRELRGESVIERAGVVPPPAEPSAPQSVRAHRPVG